jgi:RNA polymerase sigma-70 factor (ECF subfamily)
MAEEHPLSDYDLLRRITGGDEDAFTMLYRRRQAGIYRYAHQMTGSAAVAEDAVQETFLTLIRRAGQLDPARGSVAGFLYGVARNHVLRALERDRPYVLLDSADLADQQADLASARECNDPWAGLARTQSIAALRRAILALPPRYREVLVLCEVEELSYAEAAQLIGAAVGTVRSRLHRARSFLIKKLRPANEVRPDVRRGPAQRCLT